MTLTSIIKIDGLIVEMLGKDVVGLSHGQRRIYWVGKTRLYTVERRNGKFGKKFRRATN